jgi:hypothetical protein
MLVPALAFAAFMVAQSVSAEEAGKA